MERPKARLTRGPNAKATGRHHHGDLFGALKAAALDALAQTGDLRAVSLRQLARSVSVTHAALYRHYPSMDAFWDDVAAEGFEKLHASIDLVPRAPDDRVLSTLGAAYITFALENPGLFLAMFGRGARWKATDGRLSAAVSALTRTIQARVTSAANRGGWPKSRDLGVALWSMSHGLATLLSLGHIPSKNTESALRFSTELLARAFDTNA